MIPTWIFSSLCAFGLAYCLGHSTITLSFREALAKTKLIWLVDLIECPACLGFWAGTAFGYIWKVVDPNLNQLSNAIMFGFYISGTNYLLSRLTGLVAAPAAGGQVEVTANSNTFPSDHHPV